MRALPTLFCLLSLLVACASEAGPIYTCPDLDAHPEQSLCYFAPNTPPGTDLSVAIEDPGLCLVFLHEICDGEYDCFDGQDEVACPGFRHEPMDCGSRYCSCRTGGSIDIGEFCDGVVDCADGQDEPECCSPLPAPSAGGGSSSSPPDENQACWDCFNGYCTVYYARDCY
ncbi:MAG: hypothetical protein AB8H86_33230 [Polyangiales bacterium]